MKTHSMFTAALFISLSIFFAGSFSLPMSVLATCDGTGSGTGDGSGSGTGNNPCPQSIQDINLQFKLQNPLGNAGIDSLPAFVAKVLALLVLIAIPVITFFIIYAGLQFVLAAGNTEKLGKAKKTLMYTLIGAALVLGAQVLATAIQNTLVDVTNTSGFIITRFFS